MSGRALARSLAGGAFAAGVFGFPALDETFDGAIPEGVFPPAGLDAAAGLGAAGSAGRARRPVLMFRTRFIMAPVT